MDNFYDVPAQLIKSIKGQLKDKRGNLLKRFEYVIDSKVSNFDPRFIVSTAVDPYTSFELSQSAEELFPFIKSLVSSIFNNYNYFNFRQIQFLFNKSQLHHQQNARESCFHSAQTFNHPVSPFRNFIRTHCLSSSRNSLKFAVQMTN